MKGSSACVSWASARLSARRSSSGASGARSRRVVADGDRRARIRRRSRSSGASPTRPASPSSSSSDAGPRSARPHEPTRWSGFRRSPRHCPWRRAAATSATRAWARAAVRRSGGRLRRAHGLGRHLGADDLERGLRGGRARCLERSRPRRRRALRTGDLERRARLGADARRDGRLHGCARARRRRLDLRAARTPAGIHGALHISLHEPRELGEGERRWLQTVVSQCALALERSQLYDEEQRLRQQSERLQRTTAGLSNALTQSDVADVVIARGTRGTDAASAVLYEVVEERQVLRPPCARGGAERRGRIRRRLPLEESPASRGSCDVAAGGSSRRTRPGTARARDTARRAARLRPASVGVLELGWADPSRSTTTITASSGRSRARERRLSTEPGTSSPSARSRRRSSAASCPLPCRVSQACRLQRATCLALKGSTSAETGSTPSSCATAGSVSS